MSQVIVSRTIGAEVDQRIAIINGELLRKIAILDTWAVMRIAIRYMLNGTAAVTGNPNMFLGMTHDQDLGYLSANPPHAVGIHTGATSSITYSSSMFGVTWRGTKKVAGVSTGTVTDATAFASNALGYTPGDVLKRGMVVLEITKGSPNFSLQVAHCVNSGSANVDITQAQMLTAIESSTMAGAATAWSLDGAITNIVTLAVDETTDGVLNAICVGWDRSVPQMELSEIRFRKVS